MDLEKFYCTNKDEKPLDNPVTDGGYCGIFRSIACIGDSLASGELESLDENGKVGYHDYYDISWGQYLGRIAGINTVYNFSRGGMTAKWYLNTFADEIGAWARDKACQGYIIALGVNDLFYTDTAVGTLDDISTDINKCPDTFAGNMAKIIIKYKEIQPKAKFFLVTIPKKGGVTEDNVAKRELHREMMYKLAEVFDNTYVLDIYKYGPVYDKEFHKIFKLSGHLNATGYLFTAKMFASYIDYIIRHNPEDFRQLGFVGTPFHNVNYKW